MMQIQVRKPSATPAWASRLPLRASHDVPRPTQGHPLRDKAAATLRNLRGRPRLPDPGAIVDPWGKIAPTAEQTTAIRAGLQEALAVICGGPGFGKTTILRLIAQLAQQRGERVGLAAPTGAAAKRMEAATGMEAKTIHRHLECAPGEDGRFHFRLDQLPYDLMIVDETSMLGGELAIDLLARSNPQTRWVFVGDPDQLKPVNAEPFFERLLGCQGKDIVRLTVPQRTTEDSSIYKLARGIRNGVLPDLADLRSAQFQVVAMDSAVPYLIRDEAGYNLYWNLSRGVFREFDSLGLGDVQILSGRRKGELGSTALNTQIRQVFNHRARSRISWGDRVLQTANNYRLGVFNGEAGDVLSEQPVSVRFSMNRVIDYREEDLVDLDYGWARTVHSAQGNEWAGVIYVLQPTDTRRILYTAVTRAKHRLLILGSREDLASAIARTDD